MNLEKKQLNVLVAEDDEDDFLMFREALEDHLQQPVIENVQNGLALMKYLKANSKPDIIFLDLNMPIKNGKECLKILWEEHYVDTVPIVIYSTSHNIKDIEACYKYGARFYLVKPNAFASLKELLTKLFHHLTLGEKEFISKEEFVLREIKKQPE